MVPESRKKACHPPWESRRGVVGGRRCSSEVHLRTDELAQLDLEVSHVFIVENLASYLTFVAPVDELCVGVVAPQPFEQ